MEICQAAFDCALCGNGDDLLAFGEVGD